MKKILQTGVILLIILIFLVGCGKSVEKQIAEQLELGNKYLTEADCEQAIVAFNKVIKLDEKNTAGYVGLMEAYLKKGNTDEYSNKRGLRFYRQASYRVPYRSGTPGSPSGEAYVP